MGRAYIDNLRVHAKSARLLENPKLSFRHWQSAWSWHRRCRAVMEGQAGCSKVRVPLHRWSRRPPRYPGEYRLKSAWMQRCINAPGTSAASLALTLSSVFPAQGVVRALQLSGITRTGCRTSICLISSLTALHWVALMGKNLDPASTINAYRDHRYVSLRWAEKRAGVSYRWQRSPQKV